MSGHKVASPTTVAMMPYAETFWLKVEKTSTCWLWAASLSYKGYGQFHAVVDGRRRSVPAHRVSFVLAGGTLSQGMVLDHICRNRQCVNPDHLREITAAQNVLIGIGITAVNARKTACVNGHPYTEENTLRDGRGHRRCRACRTSSIDCGVCGVTVNYTNISRHKKEFHNV